MLRKLRLTAFTLRTAQLVFALVFLTAITHHVSRADFKPLVAMTVPLLVVFYGFASVLFVRGRALAAGRWQTRSIYAGETAMQATIWYLLGIFVGVTIYSFAKNLGLFGPDAPLHPKAWLLLFVAPYVLMQIGLFRFLHAIWIIAPDLLGRSGSIAVARRVSTRAS